MSSHITESDVQYLLSLNDDIVGPILNYDNVPLVNPLTKEHTEAIQLMHKNIDRYVDLFTKIPDAMFNLEIEVTSQKHPEHEIEAHHVLWGSEYTEATNAGGSLCYECTESVRIANTSDKNEE